MSGTGGEKIITTFEPKHWWESMGVLQRNTTNAHLHSGVCGIRLEECFHTWWEEYHVVSRGWFASRQICLIHCTGRKHIIGELHRNNVRAPKVGSGGCTKPTFFGYGELGHCYREVSNDAFVFSWHFILELQQVSGKSVIAIVAEGSWPYAKPHQKA